MQLEKKDIQGLIIISIFLAIILAIILLQFYLRTKGHYDPITFCPIDKDYPHTIIVLDKTESFTPSQRRLIDTYINETKDVLIKYEKLSIFTLSDKNYIAPIPEFSKCNPGTGNEANSLYQNPKKIQREFDEFFKKPLENVLNSILLASTSPKSPIMEMLKEISRRKDFTANFPKRKIILISDMIQNSKAFSQYKRNINYETFLRNPEIDNFNGIFEGVEVRIVYLIRPKYANVQGNAHILFWEKYFQDTGAILKEVRKAP